MKKYIKPVAECYNVQTAQMIAESVVISGNPADPSLGYDTKRSFRGRSFDILDDEEDY